MQGGHPTSTTRLAELEKAASAAAERLRTTRARQQAKPE
jgi:hypothetical protein